MLHAHFSDSYFQQCIIYGPLQKVLLKVQFSTSFREPKIHEFIAQSVRTTRKAHLRSISAGSALRFRLILKIALLPPDE